VGIETAVAETDVLFVNKLVAGPIDYFSRNPHGELADSGSVSNLKTLPNAQSLATSIRATAQVFEDPKSLELLARIRKIAPSNANVLIIGETGTGKELVARHVHELSHRGDKPFVAVNCGAFSETLVESELFGHEKGAFTGAFSSKPGWFEAANGGTLFLDEVGDLSPNIQVKLLRVLQEREVIRLGARKTTPIDVRLIAATNVQLEEAVLAGHFREDLFYRLRVAQVELPNLRNRPGDIIPMAEHFVREYQRRLGYGQVTLDERARSKLQTHPWPGNIRELENVIHHALLICKNSVIRAEDLHLSSIQLHRQRNDAARNSDSPELDLRDVLQTYFESGKDELFEHLEEFIVRAAFDYCHSNQVQTAKLLGVSRNVVRAKLIKIGAISALK